MYKGKFHDAMANVASSKSICTCAGTKVQTPFWSSLVHTVKGKAHQDRSALASLARPPFPLLLEFELTLYKQEDQRSLLLFTWALSELLSWLGEPLHRHATTKHTL